MKTLEQHLVNYASYHRDVRNIRTHFVGIPLIVLAVAQLLAQVPLAGGVTLLAPVLLASCLFYLALSRPLVLLMTAVMLLAGWAGIVLVSHPGALWLGLALFVLGWVIQFVGH